MDRRADRQNSPQVTNGQTCENEKTIDEEGGAEALLKRCGACLSCEIPRKKGKKEYLILLGRGGDWEWISVNITVLGFGLFNPLLTCD